MALKAVHVSDVSNLDHVPENASFPLYSTRFSKGLELNRTASFRIPKFLVIGHRGHGMNILQSSDSRMKSIKENSILSFNSTAKFPIDFIKFDVQVFFLTNGGTELYYDVRRNSLEEAIKVCLEAGLHGIVSEIKGVFINPGAVPKIKESNLCLLTYGKLNNVPEAVYMQHLMGIDGVIVDFVKEISQAVGNMIKPVKAVIAEESLSEGNGETEAKSKLQFSQQKLSFLLKLIPELIQH
ncbi:hypothetical protein CRYUN_Cryun22dG0003900 [Craigia yunnanensis]